MYWGHLCPVQGQTLAVTLPGHFCALQALLWGNTVLRQRAVVGGHGMEVRTQWGREILLIMKLLGTQEPHTLK